ncbi:hypothetical protein VIBNISFn118_590032 [Vibrio nigripulchritudo SFn118]|nr:hypothetical protein VIBNISFn118_590032 [Vibrio nigripulchritudo SFn118]
MEVDSASTQIQLKFGVWRSMLELYLEEIHLNKLYPQPDLFTLNLSRTVIIIPNRITNAIHMANIINGRIN